MLIYNCHSARLSFLLPFGEAGWGYWDTNKERDAESNYDYFGARYYDSRIGRWGGMEPLLNEYVSWSPFQYGMCNPIKLVDANGKELYIGGDQNMAFNDLTSLLPVEEQSRLTNKDGVINFNTEGLDLNQDASYELLNNLVSSTEKFLYEVFNNTTGVARETSPKYNKGDIVPYNINENPGIVNLSITPRNINNGTGQSDMLPKEGYSGQVSLGTGNWTIPVKGSDVTQPRSNIVFHELYENYSRTIQKQPYKRNDETGAHKNAIDAAKRFKKQIGEPGKAGKYVPYN